MTEPAQRLIDALGCDPAVVEEAASHEPASAAELADHSDLVLTGIIESVSADPSVIRPRILVNVKRMAKDGANRRVTVQLFPSAGVSTRDAARAFVKGTSLVAYTTSGKPVTWCGDEIGDPGDTLIPVSPFGLVISTGDPDERDELVWPMLRFTSWSRLSEVLPGGNQYPIFG